MTDPQRDQAWRLILAAARRYHVDVSARAWHELFRGGTARDKSA